MEILTFFPSPARVLISIVVRQPGMISCEPRMTFGSHCIAVWVELSMAVFVCNVVNKLELGAGVDVLKLSDRVIVEIVPDVIKKERATALPL